MHKILIFLVLVLASLFSESLTAQKKLTIEDVISGGRSFYNYLPKRYRTEFRADKDELIYTRKDVMYSRKVGNDKEIMLLVLKDLSDKVESAGGGKLTYWPQMNWISEDVVWFKSGNKYVRYNIKTTEVNILAEIVDKGDNADFCIANSRVVYTKNHDLYISSDDGELTIAKATEDGITYGQTVHRSEFGIRKEHFGRHRAIIWLSTEKMNQWLLIIRW